MCTDVCVSMDTSPSVCARVHGGDVYVYMCVCTVCVYVVCVL